MALDINGYNTTFKAFTDFAKQRLDAGDGKAIARTSEGANAGEIAGREIKAATTDSLRHVFKWFRADGDKQANNRSRELFKDAIVNMFGSEAKIPSSVKKAMLMSDYGEGKPLTARRIMAVKAAIDADGTAKALAERQATTAHHLQAAPGSDEAVLAGIGGRFTANETAFAKGMALFATTHRTLSGDLSQRERDNVGANFRTIGVDGTKVTKAVLRMALEDIACNGAADLNADAAVLFAPANNAVIRLASLEYTGKAFKVIADLAPEKRASLARILDRFMDKFKPEAREDGRVVLHDDFVRRLAANIDRLAKLDASGKLDAKALVKTCYPDEAKPGSFDLRNAIFADVDNLESVKRFAQKVSDSTYYVFENGDYTEAMEGAVTNLRERFGEDFVPNDILLSTLARGSQLSDDIENLVEEAIAQNRPVDIDAFREAVANRMFLTAVERRLGKAMEEIGRSKDKGFAESRVTMGVNILKRQPELYDAFRNVQTPEQAAAALESVRNALEAAVDRQIALRRLAASAIGTAAAILAEKLGVSPDEAKAQVNFEGRLQSKLDALARAIQEGKHPGSLVPDFDPKPLFEDMAREIAGGYVSRFDQIDALEGVDDEVKACWKRDIGKESKPTDFDMTKIASFAGKLDASELSRKLADAQTTDEEKIDALRQFCENVDNAAYETFEGWQMTGLDEKNVVLLMALRPVLAKTPELKATVAGIMSAENNILDRAGAQVGNRLYMLTMLRNMTLEA